MYQTVFKRYELKYMLTVSQKEKILKAMEPYMKPDKFGQTTIRNLYFDTDTYRLIRRSLEKPVYKEKLRLRSYKRPTATDEVFAELKRKYNGVVYKRRIALCEKEAIKWLVGHKSRPVDTQISREIDYFLEFYGELHPTVFLSYDRQAFYSKNDPNFRVTFDENILARDTDLSLESDVYGKSLLEEGKVLMEIKCAGGIPLWMTEILTAERIYKTSFSKYGTAYQNEIFPKLHVAGNMKKTEEVCL